MKLAHFNGITGVVVRVKLLDTSSTSGAGKTGLTHSSTGGIVSVIADNEESATAYTVAAGNLETITTLGTYAAPTSGKCRFKEVDATNHSGLYEIHLANSRWAVSNARSIIISVSGFSGAAPVDAEYQLSAVPATDASGNALPVASDWTSTRAGYLDATVSSRSTYAGGDTSGTTTLLSRLSATRAGYLDNLTNVDATISSRGSSTDLSTLLSRLSASRAGYLDYLNIGGAVASQSDINALNQSASRRVMLTSLEMWERPESGNSTFTIEARTWDGDGAAADADSTPTLTATGGTSGNLAASLSSATNPATGVYRWTFTVSSSATLEQVTLDVSAVIGGSTFTLTRFAAILDAVSATWTSGDRTKLTAIYDKLPSRAYFAGSTVATGAIVTNDVGMASANLDTQLSGLSTKLGTPSGSSVSDDIAAVKTDTGNLITRITSTLFSGITSLANWLGALAGKTADGTTQTEIRATTAGAGYTITTDSLEAIRDRGDAAWAGGGGSGLTGANVITVTVTDGTDPVPGAYVKFRAGGDVEVKRTNGSGVVTFTVDDNTWTISIDATNLTFEPVTLTVTGDDSVTYEMDAVATSGTAWATGDDLVAYFDARTIGQIISDTGTTVAIGSVPSHAVVTRMLLVASGAVNSSLMASKRYSESELSALDAPSAELLKSITCDIAMYNLLRRRLDLYPDRQEQMRKLSESHLERLRKGEIVLDVQSVKDAGVVSHATFTQSDVNLGVPSIRDQAGYYPARNFSR